MKENTTWHGQREIKFRAFVTDTKEMIYSSDKQTNYTFSMYLSEWLVLEKFDKSIPRWKIYIHSTIMQYTWLKDKNWVEIYEWDIVSSNLWLLKWDVYYRQEWLYEIRWAWWLFEYDMWRFEVIWNINQNPELLSEK